MQDDCKRTQTTCIMSMGTPLQLPIVLLAAFASCLWGFSVVGGLEVGSQPDTGRCAPTPHIENQIIFQSTSPFSLAWTALLLCAVPDAHSTGSWLAAAKVWHKLQHVAIHSECWDSSGAGDKKMKCKR